MKIGQIVFWGTHPITKEYFDEILNSKVKNCYVYEKDNKLIGAVLVKEYETDDYVTLKKRRIYEIYDIVVLKEYRGNHIGLALYEYVTILANQNGIDSIYVEVFSFNESAIKFYESIGMTARKIVYEDILKPYTKHKNIIKVQGTGSVE